MTSTTRQTTRARTAAVSAALLASLAVAAPAQGASAPRLERDGYRLAWTGGPSAKGKGYELRTTARKRATRVERIRGRAFLPAPMSAKKATYRVRVRGAKRWSNAVSITYAAPGFLGVTANPATDDPRNESTLRDAGVRTIKQGIRFSEVEPTRGRRDWGDLDRRLAELRQRGFNVMLSLDGYTHGPSWAENDPRAFRSFVRAAVKRYGPGTPADVTWFEPANEPYYSEHARGKKVRIGLFASDWVKIVKAGRAGNPDSRYMIPAATDVYDEATKRWRDWAGALKVEQPSIGRYIDAVATHPYTVGRSPRASAAELGTVHRTFTRIDLINRSFARIGVRKPQFITEIGWATTNPGNVRDENHPPVSEGQQAQYIRDVVSLTAARSYVSGVYFYSWRDYNVPGRAGRSYQDMGFLTNTYRPKQSYGYLADQIRRRGGR